MRYIRTKDGKIFDLESKEVSSWEYIDNDTAINEYGVEGAFYTIYYFDENKGHYSEYDGKGGHSCIFIEEKDILKQTDTIDELCDEFVVAFEENNDKITYLDLDWAIDKAKRYAGHTTIYGAVWCEWGLKYVAKMNEKGELVLI